MGAQALRDAVGRVAMVCVELRDAHRLGNGPGRGDLIRDSALHEELVSLLRETLPDGYLSEVRSLFKEGLTEMAHEELPSSLSRSWVTVGDYLQLFSQALSGSLEKAADSTFELPSRPASSIRYASIAACVSRESLSLLLNSCNELLAHWSGDSLLSPDEREIVRGLADGRRIADIAADGNVSERQLHRQLSELRERLGVSSTIEVVAFAASHGLIDGDPNEIG